MRPAAGLVLVTLVALVAAACSERAGGEANAETVIAPFDGTPIVFRDATVLPLVDSAGRYLFVVRQDGHPELGRTGRIDDAIPHARRAVEFSPGDQTARDILAQLEAAASP